MCKLAWHFSWNYGYFKSQFLVFWYWLTKSFKMCLLRTNVEFSLTHFLWKTLKFRRETLDITYVKRVSSVTSYDWRVRFHDCVSYIVTSEYKKSSIRKISSIFPNIFYINFDFQILYFSMSYFFRNKFRW